MIRKNCNNCGKFIWRYPSQFKGKKNIYCSRQCSGTECEGATKECLYCKKDFYVTDSVIEKGKGNFCSRKCYSNYDFRKEVKCANCGKKYKKHLSRIKRCEKDYCSKKCYGKGISDNAKYPKTRQLRKRIWKKRQRDNIGDTYLKDLICQSTGLGHKDIPNDLIELKRLNIKRKRIIRKQNK